MDLQNVSFFLADQFLKGTAILVLAGLASHVIRNTSAAKRNAVWLSAFAALLLLPFTHLASPAWTWNPVARPQEMPRPQPASTLDHYTGVSQIEFTPTLTQVVPTEQPWRWPDWKAMLTIIWGAGAGLILLRRAIVSVQIHLHFRGSKPALSGVLHETLLELLQVHGIARPLRLRVSPLCHIPVTWGALRPVILLPGDAAEWPVERIRIVLAHELGHIRRWDFAVRTLAQLACAFHWFNPLVWMASRELHLTQEQACDDLILNDKFDPAEYATALVETVRRVHSSSSLSGQVLAMAQCSTLETRIGAIMDAQRNRGATGFLLILANIVTVVLSLVCSTLAQVAPQNPAPEATQKNVATRSPSVVSGDKRLNLRMWVIPATFLWEDAESRWPLGDKPRRIDAVPLLKEKGVTFPENSTAFHVTDFSQTPATKLVVKNTQENLNRIDDIIEAAVMKARRMIAERARKIIIPKLELNEATLDDAFAFLVGKSLELDPEKQGIKITISPDLGKTGGATTIDPNQARITVSLKNVPLSEAVRYLTGLAGVTFVPTAEGYTIVDIPKAEFFPNKPEVLHNAAQAPVGADNAIATKQWRIPALFFPSKDVPNPADKRADAKEILSEAGVAFPPGCSAIWLPNSSKLLVRNTRENLDLVDQFVQRLAATVPAVEWAALIAAIERDNPVPKKNSGIVIPTLEIRDLSLPEAVELLRAKALEADPKKKGISITIGGGPEEGHETIPVSEAARVATVSLSNIPVEEALIYVAGLFSLKVEKTSDGFRLVPHPRE